mgnify:FL=1
MKRNRLFIIISIIGLSVFGARGSALYAQDAISPKISSNKISLDIKGMDVVDVIKMLATRNGINVVVGKNVSGKVTLFLKEVDMWDAFEIILLSNELAYDKKGDIINIMTQRDYELIYGERYKDAKEAAIVSLKYAKAIDLARALNQIKTNIGRIVVDEGSNTMVLIDSAAKVADMKRFIKETDLPVQTKVFSLNYAQVDKLSPKIQDTLTKGVGTMKIDERTNKIVITDYPEKIIEIAALMKAFDEKTPQVLIDAQIIEVRPSNKFEMGVDWDFWIEKNFKLASSLPISTSGRLVVGTPSVAPTQKGDYKAILDLLRTIGNTKILSSPRIMALNNQEAMIMVGSKEAYASTTTVTGDGGTVTTAENITFVDVGIKLHVTPTINRENFVTMKIKPEVSSVGSEYLTAKGETIPEISTSEAETTVMVKDGVTVIIGGLKKDEKYKTQKEIPFIAKIPLVGLLFRNLSEERKNTELVILLTPHIMSGESSFTEFSDIRPKDGAIIKLDKEGNVKQDVCKDSNEDETMQAGWEYYRFLIDKVSRVAKKAAPVG